MQITVEAEKLRDGLSKVLSVIDKKNPRAILTFCMFSFSPNGITLEATDLEVSTRLTIDAECEETGRFCVNPKNLFDIAKEMPSGPLLLEINQEANLLKLKCQQIDISLMICSADEYPNLTFDSNASSFELSSEQVLDIIQKTYHAISYDETRLFLNGIFLQELNSKLRAVSTNGYSLALVEAGTIEKTSEVLEDGIIIPKKGVFELKKLAESFPTENIKLFVDESFMHINAMDKHFLSVRLIARDYPPYQTVIPNKTTYSMTVQKNNLVTAIKRVKLLANEKSNAIKLTMHNNELTISANHPTLGDACEKIDVEYTGKDIEIGFNAKFIMDSLSVYDDGDVTFEFNNELSPFIIKSSQMSEFLGVVMPLKL